MEQGLFFYRVNVGGTKPVVIERIKFTVDIFANPAVPDAVNIDKTAKITQLTPNFAPLGSVPQNSFSKIIFHSKHSLTQLCPQIKSTFPHLT